MTILLHLAVLVVAGALGASPPLATSVQSAGPVVHLGDVVDLSSLPPELQQPAGQVEVARFAPGQTELRFSSSQVLQRARTQVPALGRWLSIDPGLTIEASRTLAVGSGLTAARLCLEALKPIEGGAYPTGEDLHAIDCAGRAPARHALRYDPRVQTVRAERDIEKGEVLPAVPSSLLSAVRPSQTLYLRIRTGPVTVTREVRVLQPAPPGRPLFVASASGSIFAAPPLEVRP